MKNTLKFLSAQESDNVLSARSCFLIGNGKCKQLSDWSELELSTVLDSCALRNLSVSNKRFSSVVIPFPLQQISVMTFFSILVALWFLEDRRVNVRLRICLIQHHLSHFLIHLQLLDAATCSYCWLTTELCSSLLLSL